MTALSAFGLFAVTAMLACYALEDQVHTAVDCHVPRGVSRGDNGIVMRKWPHSNVASCVL
jgi:hypothetical protein